MVYESAKDATFSIAYGLTPDRFTVHDKDNPHSRDTARFTLGTKDDFILFDNETPAKILFATHTGNNVLAIDILSRVLFDQNYAIYCESVRKNTAHSHKETTEIEAVVPYANRRRLARIALHAESQGASQEARNLHIRILATNGDGGGEDRQLSSELSDDQPAGAPVRVQPDF